MKSPRPVIAGPPSPARLRAAVSRIDRNYANAFDLIDEVFGAESSTSSALEDRVRRLREADASTIPARASELHLLTLWMAAVCEVIEAENEPACDLRPFLASIISECELIATVGDVKAAA